MKKILIGLAALLAVLAIVALIVGYVAYRKGLIYPPTVTLEVSAKEIDGTPVSGAAVLLDGQPKGQTNAEGRLSVALPGPAPGTEMVVRATIERRGVRFAPVEQRLIVKRWERDKPETLAIPVQLLFEVQEAVSEITVESAGAPVAGADVTLDGKSIGTSDATGLVKIDLAPQHTRQAHLGVSLKGYEDHSQDVTLEGGARISVSLVKKGANALVRAVQERMGRFIGVDAAEVTVGGAAAGKTDASGLLRTVAPAKDASVTVRKDGFQPDPAKGKLPAEKAAEVTLLLSPVAAPVFKVALLPSSSSVLGDKEVEPFLPEIDERLADFLFAHPCFERVDAQAFAAAMRQAKLSPQKVVSDGWNGTPLGRLADVVVAATASKSEGDLVLSVRAVAVTGKTLAGFADTGKPTKLKVLCESATDKIVEAFPFEGRVLEAQEGRVVTSLGSAGDRSVKRGGAIALYRVASAAGKGPAISELGRGKVKTVDADRSEVEIPAAVKAQVGDKVAWVPPESAATLDGMVTFTVKAGKQGSERAMGDVTVYRNGVWVGTTAASGDIKVPVHTGEKVTFIFVRGGIPAHVETLKIERGKDRMGVLIPAAMCRLTVESEPSGARVSLDGEELGATPLDTDVFLGFHRVRVDAGGDFRAYDKVLELVALEESLTGSRRIVLQKDVLRETDALLAHGDVDRAIAVLDKVGKDHPDFSQAHHRLAGLYLDEKKDAGRAIQEFETVLSLPENRELVNKRFAVTFLNLGRAYYLQKSYEKAIAQLTVARDNKRFFPRDAHDRATHDTLYYLALASHKLYHAQPSDRLLQETAARWKDYFDFFPEALKDDDDVKTARAGAQEFYAEIQRKLKE